MTRAQWLRTRTKQLAYFALAGLFGFDRWHYRIVRENCGYFAQVRALHERIRPRTTVEIGCGLGEIISGLQSAVRVGIDRDAAVIKAARVLRSGIHFRVADDEPGFKEAPDGVTCLLLLNWLHRYSPEELRQIGAAYVAAFMPSWLIFDVIHEQHTGYLFRHDPDVLRDLGTVSQVVDAGDGIRSLVLLNTGYRSLRSAT